MLAAEAAHADPSAGIASLADFSILENASRVAVAVSGGSDSMALLHLTLAWATPRGMPVAAITFDHGMRQGSAAEAAWVGTQCSALGVSQCILRWQGMAPVSGIQGKARQARYDALTGWCKDHDFDVLLTGHTMDDQAETVVMRRLRTQSERSLAGIWRERLWNGIRIVRPLLAARRQDLKGYLTANQVAWVDDPSNADDRFERIAIRNAMADDEIDVHASTAKTAMSRVVTRRAQAQDWYADHVDAHPEGYFSLPRALLAQCDATVQEHVLEGLVFAMAGNHLKSVASRQRVMAWMAEAGSGRMTIGGAVIVRRAARLLIGREFGRIVKVATVVNASSTVLWDYRFQITASQEASVWAKRHVGLPGGKTTAPAFVTDGYPVALDGSGREVALAVVFCPKLDFS